MSLSAGYQLGSYEVVSLLGAGGMGEVYRARDTNLGRDVALKVLPDAFARDPERLGRFRREAQVLASLNHPHIASIYGFEDANPAVGSGRAAPVLVLELVEGPTLADRLVGGPLPLEDAWPIARQICQALEAAHEHGAVHRDLMLVGRRPFAGDDVAETMARVIERQHEADVRLEPPRMILQTQFNESPGPSSRCLQTASGFWSSSARKTGHGTPYM
jgi:eukaryotic-like serine/threonine-protein kinase